MGAGIRPKGAFPYAALRYKECRGQVPCFGKNAKTVPDAELCDTCVHLKDCKNVFYGRMP